MKPATTHPTPQRVVDAIQVVAAWLREIEAVEALVSPEGGASFHGERAADRLLAGWGEAEARLAELERDNKLLREIVADTTQMGVLAAQVLGEAMGR